MSGTSMDAIDAVLVDLSKSPPRLITHSNTDIPTDTRTRLLRLCEHGEIDDLARLDIEMGLLFAKAAQKIIDSAGIDTKSIRAIGSHGQTVRHHPHGDLPYTLQIADPNIIAEKTGITTIADFRRRDIAAGGQGAPLVPAFHNAVFRNLEKCTAIVNIGGMANATILVNDTQQTVIGFDTGPGNILMDTWINQQKGSLMDKNGLWAASGDINQELLKAMLNDPYFRQSPPKSTGREYFNGQWLDKYMLESKQDIPSADIQATLCELTAVSIADALIPYRPDQTLLCGGGIHNRHLFLRLETHITCPVKSSSDFGIDPDLLEAIAFAWLAKQRLDNRPGNIPYATGAKHPVILGGIYSS